ncbi:hypothetical protein [Streptomyces sp. NBC_01615]|uniref:hypothetical protein n=1 Tax=Streptomyces sp. NBC_01615 TaxID=2975898 RepID=UPI00386A3920
MRRSALIAALSGALALPLAALPAAPAQAAESDVSFSNVVIKNGKSVVVGTSNEVEVPVSYTLTHKVKLDDQWVFLYRGTLADEANVRATMFGPDCTTVSSTKKNCTERILIEPKEDLTNADAATWKAGGLAIKSSGGDDTDGIAVTTNLKRYAKLTANATPEPVTAGGTVTVTGKLTRANWNTHKYAGYGSQSVKLQFRASGSDTWTTLKTVTSSSTGGLKATAKASASGAWRWSFAGTSTTGPATSAGDSVAVQ